MGEHGENDYYNKETHETVTVRPEQILELNLGHTNLTKVERTDHLVHVVWADWVNVSNKVHINNEDETDERNPEQAETHNIPNRLRTGSSDRDAKWRRPSPTSGRSSPNGRQGRSKDPKMINSSPRNNTKIIIPFGDLLAFASSEPPEA